PKIGDFGLARSQHLPSGTVVGQIMGTPRYMSPEQCRGQRCAPASDLYALGVMLFEMVTGQPPFPGPSIPEFLYQHLAHPAPLASSVRAGLPADLDDLLKRALEKDPGQRFQGAAEFRKALQSIYRGLTPGKKASSKRPRPQTDRFEPEPGRTLAGRYELVRILGQGGMGQVWLAGDQAMDGAEVAVKLLPPELWRDIESRTNVIKEARLSLKLTHPNIVRLINLEPGDPPFLVMEYVAGRSLADELASRNENDAGPMTPEEALPIVEGLAAALAHAHAHKIIHRDLKPANILMGAGPDGRVGAKLADFGIAAELSSFRTRQTGVVPTGTLAYMSPEQMACQKLDERSDVYALGATVYQMLTLSPPFTGGDLAWAIKNEPVPVPERVPAPVWAVLEAALAKSPSDRPASVARFAVAFRDAVVGAPTDEVAPGGGPVVPARVSGPEPPGAVAEPLARGRDTLPPRPRAEVESIGPAEPDREEPQQRQPLDPGPQGVEAAVEPTAGPLPRGQPFKGGGLALGLAVALAVVMLGAAFQQDRPPRNRTDSSTRPGGTGATSSPGRNAGTASAVAEPGRATRNEHRQINLTVTVRPSDAELFVNEQSQWQGSRQIVVTTGVPVRLKARLAGYVDVTRTLVPEAFDKAEVELLLERRKDQSTGPSAVPEAGVRWAELPPGLAVLDEAGTALVVTPRPPPGPVGRVTLRRTWAFRLPQIAREALNLILRHRVEPVDEGRMLDAAVTGLQSWINDPARKRSPVAHVAIEGMMARLEDPAGRFIPPGADRKRPDETRGAFGGLGMMLRDKGGRPMIFAVFPDSPAYRAGVRAGDTIVGLDGREVAGSRVEELARMARGAPGTGVKVSIIREGATNPVELALIRAVIRPPTVRTRMIDGEIGYAYVSSFDDRTAEDLAVAMGKLEARGMKAMVLDLRGSAGGLLEAAVQVCRLFLTRERIVTVRGRDGEETSYSASGSPRAPALPLIVLVDQGSMGVAEVVAGALKDARRGIVLGVRSSGKAAMSTVQQLSDGSAVALTTAYYYRPSGLRIQNAGIDPDIEERLPAFDGAQLAEFRAGRTRILDEAIVESSEPGRATFMGVPKHDAQLARAVSVLRGAGQLLKTIDGQGATPGGGQ
ncbi:MAG: protein kinase, partial [Candidatus Riflebacteria bacterium]|nr:protein kinase [Candidatus Riflebacteria bacterium]